MKIDEFDLADGAVQAQDRDDRRGIDVLAAGERIVALPIDVTKALNCSFLRACVAGTHAEIIVGTGRTRRSAISGMRIVLMHAAGQT